MERGVKAFKWVGKGGGRAKNLEERKLGAEGSSGQSNAWNQRLGEGV